MRSIHKDNFFANGIVIFFTPQWQELRLELQFFAMKYECHHIVSSFTSVKLPHIIYLSVLNIFLLISFIVVTVFRNKFVEFDMKPVCKKCYEKFPLELKKRLKKLAETLGRK